MDNIEINVHFRKYYAPTTSSSFTPPYISSLFFNGVKIDEPIATWKFNDSSNKSQVYTRYIFIPDSLGSIIALSGSSASADTQSTIASYAYDSYGNIVAICGGDIANQNLLRYTGREYTPLPDIADYSQLPNSLYHFRHRTADVQFGTFLQQDPKWYTNLYPYVGDNPIMNTDPTGLFKVDGIDWHYRPQDHDSINNILQAHLEGFDKKGIKIRLYLFSKDKEGNVIFKPRGDGLKEKEVKSVMKAFSSKEGKSELKKVFKVMKLQKLDINILKGGLKDMVPINSYSIDSISAAFEADPIEMGIFLREEFGIGSKN